MTDLDKLNTDRILTAKKRIAHSIQLLKQTEDSWKCFENNNDKQPDDDLLQMKETYQALNLLITANEDIQYSCKHFNWNDDICLMIDEAIADLGIAASAVIYNAPDEIDAIDIDSTIFEARIILSKCLGILMAWFDDDIKNENI